ncbi:hypothetical protein GCM10025865_15540 [Paraoerskovia sediminicola]|uniref:DUF4440 domain-containing protein n=1 Tax=Paraoerskovia sediminicola TaxID=1138587 RepID=A0ABM8G2F5_9CELL|nr:DUF4440 domain-containing protein [Paraoerskovia sediminicola]BDZ42255.1 hypothetical protein GCM10025865_15540 [Paraoerskovia sediminicola]
MADEPEDLERQGWQALAADAAAATTFYTDVLDAEVLMLLPGGLVIDDRDDAIDAMGGAPWESFDLQDVRQVELADDVAVVAYGVVASRSGQEYSATVSSTYARRDGEWRLAVHQQTPR